MLEGQQGEKGECTKVILVFNIMPLIFAKLTYSSSRHLDHIDIRSSQNSTKNSEAILFRPSVGSFPKIIDANDSEGVLGKAIFANSSKVLRRPRHG
jgi:hypothetical protein